MKVDIDHECGSNHGIMLIRWSRLNHGFRALVTRWGFEIISFRKKNQEIEVWTCENERKKNSNSSQRF